MLISKEKINTGRQTEVDLLKAFTVVFSMIIIHVFDYDAVTDSVDFDNGFAWVIDSILGGVFAAPIFMFCMGMGMEYSRNNSADKIISRGLKLLTIGQVLNLFRYELILAIMQTFVSFDEYLSGQVLNFSSDIMQLAGLSFLLMGLFHKLKLKNWMIFLIAAAMSIAGTLLQQVQTGYYPFDQFLGFFWGTDTESFFPLFNWFIFIAAGKCFGAFYQRVCNKNLFYLIAVPVSIISFATVWHVQMHTDLEIFKSFDHHGFSWMMLSDALAVILMAPLPLGIFYVISKLLPEKALSVMSHPSRHINQYYCISWWWIMLGYLYVWANNIAALLSVWLNVLTFTIITVVFYNNYFKEKVEAFCSRHKVVLTTLVWVITLGAAFYAFSVCNEFPNLFNDYLR